MSEFEAEFDLRWWQDINSQEWTDAGCGLNFLVSSATKSYSRSVDLMAIKTAQCNPTYKVSLRNF